MRIHRPDAFLYIYMHSYALLEFLYPLHSSAFLCILVHPTCAQNARGRPGAHDAF